MNLFSLWYSIKITRSFGTTVFCFSQTWNIMPSSGCHSLKGTWINWGQWSWTRMVREMKTTFCEDRLKELGMFNLEKWWLRDAVNYEYLRGCQVEEGANLFLVAPEGSSRTNEFKLQGRFQLNITNNFYQVLSSGTFCLRRWQTLLCWSRGWTTTTEDAVFVDSLLWQGLDEVTLKDTSNSMILLQPTLVPHNDGDFTTLSLRK